MCVHVCETSRAVASHFSRSATTLQAAFYNCIPSSLMRPSPPLPSSPPPLSSPSLPHSFLPVFPSPSCLQSKEPVGDDSPVPEEVASKLENLTGDDLKVRVLLVIKALGANCVLCESQDVYEFVYTCHIMCLRCKYIALQYVQYPQWLYTLSVCNAYSGYNSCCIYSTYNLNTCHT